jgi:hypothetical protein
MKNQLEKVIIRLFNESNHVKQKSRLAHFTAIPFKNGTYVAVLRKDGTVSDDFVNELKINHFTDGHVIIL